MAKAQKRQRKKEQRRAKIEEEIRQQQALRRRRVILNLILLGVVAGLIAAFIFRARQDDTDTASPTSTPTPSEGGGVACGGEPIERESPPPTFTEPPAMSIDTSKTYTATIETSCGTVVVALADDQSPNTVNSFVFLAREGFYDGLTFYRVVPGFAIQGGNPAAQGIGYKVVDIPPSDFRYVRGTVAMAKAGADPPGSSGSDFFLVPGSEAESLPPDYAVLGKVVSGLEVLEEIQSVPTGEPTGERPVDTVYIVKITIEES